jgi:hypothetical protein
MNKSRGTVDARKGYNLPRSSAASRCYATFAAHPDHAEPVVGYDGLRMQFERCRPAARLLLRCWDVAVLPGADTQLLHGRDARRARRSLLLLGHRFRHVRPRNSGRRPQYTGSAAAQHLGSATGSGTAPAKSSRFSAPACARLQCGAHLSARRPFAQVERRSPRRPLRPAAQSSLATDPGRLDVGLHAVRSSEASHVNSSRFPHLDGSDRRVRVHHCWMRKFSNDACRRPTGRAAAEATCRRLYHDRPPKAHDPQVSMLFRCVLRHRVDRPCRGPSLIGWGGSRLSKSDSASQVIRLQAHARERCR